jgi:nitrate reductase NapD
MPLSDHPSRREVLNGRLAAPAGQEAHVSSLLVHARPDHGGEVRSSLAGMPGVEVHAAQDGKIIVTLETETEAEIVTRLNEISLLEGVMSAALVFHHFEAAAEDSTAASGG